MVYSWIKNKIPHYTCVKKRMNDDILIICASDLMIYYLNSTVAFFINAIDGEKSVDEIKRIFLSKYDIAEAELERDLVELVRDLQWKKILFLE